MLKPKIKLFILFFIFIINLQANSIKNNLIDNISISTDNKTFVKIKNLEKDFYKKNRNNTIFRIHINKENLNNKIYYFILKYKQGFISIDVPYIIKDNLIILKIDKNMKDSINITFNFKNELPFFNLTIYNNFEYTYLLNIEKILFGFSYGIIFCTFLYNFVFFLYNKQKAFLYYSVLQVFLILILITRTMDMEISGLFNNFEIIFNYSIDILINLTLILSILFNMEFLNTKKFIPKIHKFLWLILTVIFLDSIIVLFQHQSILFEYIPYFLIIFILLGSAFVVLSKGYKPALFYIIGWLSLFIFIFFSETNFLEINGDYLLHIGFPLESLLFSFALGYKIKQLEDEKQKNEGILINQSKLASMGEMISNIAHQWRQPLTHLSYIIMNIQAASENKRLDDTYVQKKIEEANSQILFMSNTIDDFRNFFKVSKKKERFNLVDCINETINLQKNALKSLGIKLDFSYKEELTIETYQRELVQVLFNLINNSKEALIKNEIINPFILIELFIEKKEIQICVTDNANGIDEKNMKRIFEPYFTTKEKGLGIGLYICKTIIENNIKGTLKVDNIKNGAKFTISLNINTLDFKRIIS